MQISLRSILLVAFPCLLTAAAQAQIPAPPVPHTPDLLGIYTGMPAGQARAMLQKHSNTVNVQMAAHPEQGFGLHISDPSNPDEINVYLTDAPNDPYVWMIQRAQIFSGRDGMPISLDVVLGALREKYGKETMSTDHGGGGLYVYWLFDQDGRLLATSDPNLQGCDANMIVTSMSIGVNQGAMAANGACYKAFFAVKAVFNRAAPPLLNGYSVELVNLPLAFQAAMRTGAMKNAGANKAKQDELNRAKQNRPTF